MHLNVQVSKTLGRLIVQTFTTHVSNHLINFPVCSECKKEGQKPIKRPKTKDQNSFTLFVQNNKIININNDWLPLIGFYHLWISYLIWRIQKSLDLTF